MRLFYISVLIILGSTGIRAQNTDSLAESDPHVIELMLSSPGNLMIGGYGEVHFNQQVSSQQRHNSQLDVHRMVILTGYRFNRNTHFITEIEFEHVKEVYVEQAFLQYKINSLINLRAGLLLVPMGLINEYHEPTSFHGVERPQVEKYIVPTTWREIGAGLNGNIIDASIKYHAYIMTGPDGYSDDGRFNGQAGFRSGRQKGSEAYMSSPSLATRIEYYGLPGLQMGLSGFFGRSQSSLYHGLDPEDALQVNRADSSVVDITMIGADLRFRKKALSMTGQFYYAGLGNTSLYNEFTGSGGVQNDLGSAMSGFYAEIAYNVLHSIETTHSLYPFFRYEWLNTHYEVPEGTLRNDTYERYAFTFGLSWFPVRGAVIKTDISFEGESGNSALRTIFNAGIGVMF